MKRCGECANAWPIAGDLTKRICRGGPPQVIVIQGPAPASFRPGQQVQVQVQLQMVYPNVNIADIACGVFKRADKQEELPDAIATVGKVDERLQKEFGDSAESIDYAALPSRRA